MDDPLVVEGDSDVVDRALPLQEDEVGGANLALAHPPPGGPRHHARGRALGRAAQALEGAVDQA